MQNVFILGFSEAVLSMVLETFLANNICTGITIVKNIDSKSSQPFMPGNMNVPVIHSNDWHLPGKEFFLLFGVATPVIKRKVFDSFQQSHSICPDNFISLFHPSSIVASTVRMGKGSYIEPGSVISPFASLGFAVTINRGVTVGHHTQIHDFATLNPGVHVAGNCIIEQEVQIGIGAVVFEKVRIGKGAVIGGGSVVTNDVPENVIAWGNPCKVIKNLTNE